MRRLQKSQCGYDQYKCKGIVLLPAPLPICCDNSPAPSSRSNDNNFYNIPSRFQGIVQQTKYIDLSDVVQSSSLCCDFRYDPFEQDGFRDLFATVKSKLEHNYSNSLADYGCSNSTYYGSDAIQKPGFLLPTPELNAFYPAVLQAVPTVALASPINNSYIRHGTPIESACSGFKIQAEIIGEKLNFSVSTGKALVEGSQSGFIVIPQSGTESSWSQSITRQQTMNIQIYVIVVYSFQDGQWLGDFAYKQDGSFAFTPSPFSKQVQLGTIKVQKDTVQVIQQVCSPVDVRDWVSQVELPTDNDTSLYVFSYQGSSTMLQWYPVRDC